MSLRDLGRKVSANASQTEPAEPLDGDTNVFHVGSKISLPGQPPVAEFLQPPRRPSSVGSAFSASSLTDRGGRKRQRASAEPGDNSDDLRSPSWAPQSNTEAKKRPFACPFYKLSPDRHSDCRRYELARVKDVKQHLFRKHKKIHCGRCYLSFDTLESREVHIRNIQPCELSDNRQFYISDQQWDKLSDQYVSRGKRVENQWLDIWNILFPTLQPPHSVFLEGHMQEAVLRLRTLWNRKGKQIVDEEAEYLFRSPTIALGRTDLFGVVNRAFDRILGYFETETETTAPNHDHTYHSGMSHLPEAPRREKGHCVDHTLRDSPPPPRGLFERHFTFEQDGGRPRIPISEPNITLKRRVSRAQRPQPRRIDTSVQPSFRC